VAGAKQLKVGLGVADLDASCALYLKLGFKQIPHPDQPKLRYLTFGYTWLILRTPDLVRSFTQSWGGL
jgi:lactoylglutathione lyase